MPEKKKAFITTVPFGTVSREPLDLLEKEGIEYLINPEGKKMTDKQFADFVEDVDYIVAGLPKFTNELLDRAKKLKLIVRVGVGLDNVPFEETNKRGIKVGYTPNANTLAVAELTVGFMIDALRRFSYVDRVMRKGEWNKYMGQQLQGKTVGIIGVGRIGKKLIELLQPFGVHVLGNDLVEDHEFAKKYNFEYVNKERIYKESDILTLHLSYSSSVYHLINKDVLDKMKDNAILINVARGGVVDEDALYQALKNDIITGAVLDVYEKEPYKGFLIELDNVLLTAHIGAGTKQSRRNMEVSAVEEVIRFHRKQQLLNEIDHN